jgi:hypothetical protein
VIRAHRRALGDVGVAVRFEVHDLPAPSDECYDASDLASIDVALHRGADASKPLGRHSDVLGFSGGDRTGQRGAGPGGADDGEAAHERSSELGCDRHNSPSVFESQHGNAGDDAGSGARGLLAKLVTALHETPYAFRTLQAAGALAAVHLGERK